MAASQVSVIIPTFNRARILPRALDSVLAQTHRADALIVVDDGSTDVTAELIATKYPQVECISQENYGVSAARNKGITMTNTDWLAFLDSDDEWLPQKLEWQMAALKVDCWWVM